MSIRLRIKNPDLSEMEQATLTADITASDSTITVSTIEGFGVDDYIVLEGVGVQKAEIVRAHGSTAPSGSTITLNASNVPAYSHDSGKTIFRSLWNQITIQSSSDGSTWAAVTSVNISWDDEWTTYTHTSGTSATYYRTRFYNSGSLAYSSWSDTMIGTGWARNTRGGIKEEALRIINRTLSSGKELNPLITDTFLNDEVNNCLEEIQTSKTVGWSFQFKGEQTLGTISTGAYRIAIPSDCIDDETAKGIKMIRIQGENECGYIDKSEWNRYFEDVVHTTLASSVATTDTTITLTDSTNFDSSGTIDIEGDSITYTGNSSNILTGCSGITSTHSSGKDVWQGITTGIPIYYTVFDEYVVFDKPFASSINGKSVYVDYYADLSVNSDDDVVYVKPLAILHHYLAWKILMRLGLEKYSSQAEYHRGLYETKLNKAKLRDVSQYRQRLIPKIKVIT